MVLKNLLKYQNGGLTPDKIQTIINKYGRGKSPFTANDYIEVSKNTGVPVDLLLAQGIQESNLGTQGRAVRTRNVGNVGNTDNGAENHQNTWLSGLYRQADLLKKEYKVSSASDVQRLISNDFSRPVKGGKYASASNYGSKVGNLINTLYGKKVYDTSGKEVTSKQTENYQYADSYQPIPYIQTILPGSSENNLIDFWSLPSSTQNTIIENQKLQQEALSQKHVSDELEQRNALIEQVLKQKQFERNQLLSSIPQAQYIGDNSNLQTNPFTTLLQGDTQYMQQGGQVNVQGINSILSNLNPKNWFKEDYSNLPTYGDAYKKARNNGDTEFMYKGKRYNTNYRGTPDQQMRETGLTDQQKQNKNFIEKRLEKNIYPYSYDNLISRTFNAVVRNKPEEGLNREDLYTTRKDAFNLYNGKPQKYNTFSVSSYKPSVQKNSNSIYYSINNRDEMFDKVSGSLSDYFNNNKITKGRKIVQEDKINEVMGKYTMSSGSDQRGDYVSYYDLWDLSPANFGKPFEVYDRFYYRNYKDRDGKEYRGQMFFTDKELKNLDTVKGDFNIKELQKELYQRGYDLPKSTTKETDKKGRPIFDGVLGQETLDALQQFKNTYKK